jgi:hypothetical protein
MRVVEHGAGPGVQHSEKTRGRRSEVARVAGEFEDRCGRGLHEETVDDLGVSAGERAHLLGQSKGEMVKWGVQEEPPALGIEPAAGLFAVALGAVAVPAGVVGVELLITVVTAKDLAAERGRATALDGRHGAQMSRQERFGELLPIRCAVAAEDVRHLEQAKVSERREKKRLRDPS